MRLTLILPVLVVTALAVGSLFSYQTAYDLHVTQRRLEAERLLESFQDTTERLFEYSDVLLRSGRFAYSQYGHDYDWASYIKSLKPAAMEEISGVFTLVDRNGWVTYQSKTPRSKLRDFGSMADLDHFQYFQKHPGDALYVGATRYGRMTGQLQYRLARPLFTPDGMFDGLVMLTLKPEYLVDTYKNLQLGPNASLTVLTLEPKLIARLPAPSDDIWNKNIGDAIAQMGVNSLGDKGQAYGVDSPFEKNGKQDVFFRKLDNYPVIIAVGLSEKDLWDEFANYRLALGILFTTFCLATVIVSALIYVLRSKNRQLGEAVVENQRIAEDLRVAAVAFETQEGILITDTRGNITKVNEAFSVSTGYAADELIGKTPAILKSGRHDAAFYKDMWSQISASGRWKGEIWDRRKDGSIFPKWMTITAVKSSDGQVTHYVAAHMDITERKRVERELEEYRHSLEEMVAERTQQLSLAKEEAEAANVAKSAFLANMSHELRTPLHQLTSLAKLMHRDPLTEKQNSYLEKISTSGKRLTMIIDTILQLTEIEANRVKLADSVVNIGQLIADAVAKFQETAAAKGVSLVAQQPGILPQVMGDPAHLSSALINYIGNALRFTEAGGICVKVHVVSEDSESALVRFEVEDTGAGIPPEALPRLFSIFEQVDNSSTRKHDGTGLGLARTKKLAQIMGGDAGCASTQGVGSTFWFTARLRKA